MIIKSHIRGGFRSAADYLKEQGQNEKTRLVEMSDPHVQNLDEAFRAMWAVSDGTKVKKPLHHVSINPMKDERLTDAQVRRICKRLEERYGYVSGEHQRVIVEHIKEGRQHFHVMWNRVSLTTGKPHYPYMHKKQSKIVAREMEKELGLKRPQAKRTGGAIRLGKISSSQILYRPNFDMVAKSCFSNRILVSLPTKPVLFSPKSDARQEQNPRPQRPRGGFFAGMCEAQIIDFLAACDGQITWGQYFMIWGKEGAMNHAFN
ncbi:MAG: relaxase/mobilization nuclease domain-containing protein [Alphaproteobacteria bacterium]|nr:relaxase/mobilization nuclease domain-containing protein [Alphaproteobacteria bacterium]